tara:strand:- start:63 stop:602 length:540 start_codon:yes stop_codon:yes gene_type:complete
MNSKNILTLVDFYKICGIFFLIGMCWYFVFVVFKTNKDFLYSVTKPVDNSSSLNNLKTLFGSEGLIEAFKEGMDEKTRAEQDEQKSALEAQLEKEEKSLMDMKNGCHLGIDGTVSGIKAKQKLVLKIMKTRREHFKTFAYFMAHTDFGYDKDTIQAFLRLRDMYETLPDDYEKAMAEWR